MKTHKDLDVWNKSVNLVTDIYFVTKSFSREEMYGIASQIRRSAVSIPSNISEGAARLYTKEFIYYLLIALGSIADLETQLIISDNLEYIEKDNFNDVLNKLVVMRKMIIGLIKNLKIKKNKTDYRLLITDY